MAKPRKKKQARNQEQTPPLPDHNGEEEEHQLERAEEIHNDCRWRDWS